MNSKYLRYMLGFVLLFLILLSFYISKIMLFTASIFFIVISMMEYRNMFKVKEIYPHKFIPEITGILCSYIFIYSDDISDHSMVMPIILGSIIFSFIVTIIRNKKPYFLTSLSTISAIFFIICGLYIIKLTYYFEENYAWYLILVYFLAVLSGDFAASIIGPKIKPYIYISPQISPNKTLSGAIANLLCSCLACLLLKNLLDFSICQCLILGIIISIFSQLGDLTISSIKRDLDIKHSGNLFYEYGGILDRMDAFIFSAPAAYYFLFHLSII